MFFEKKIEMPTKERALKGRSESMLDHLSGKHFVNGNNILPPYPEDMRLAQFGLGCFWGAERKFWELPEVYATAVGYAAGYTPNPSYDEVCSGMTGHNEVVLVIYDENKISFNTLLKTFWEAHNPTQGMRQGNDRGTQYRSGIYYYNDVQKQAADASLKKYQLALNKNSVGAITTEVIPATEFYYAEEYHQQYLAKNPNGYCGLGGTGVSCAL